MDTLHSPKPCNKATPSVATSWPQRYLSFVHNFRELSPGTGLPVVGNVLDMPSEKEWFTFAQWGEMYG